MKVSNYEDFLTWLNQFKSDNLKRAWLQGKREPKKLKHWT